MRVHLRLGQLSVEQQAAIEALDLLNPALFVVDASTGIKFANLAGDALLARMQDRHTRPSRTCPASRQNGVYSASRPGVFEHVVFA
jgi:hypothetical protein